jgi:hypothetical protein
LEKDGPITGGPGPRSYLSHKYSYFFPSMRLFGRQPGGRPLSSLSTSLPPLLLTNRHEWYPQLASPFQHMESGPLKGYRGAHGRRARRLKPSQLRDVFFGPRPGYSSQIVLRAKGNPSTGEWAAEPSWGHQRGADAGIQNRNAVQICWFPQQGRAYCQKIPAALARRGEALVAVPGRPW